MSKWKIPPVLALSAVLIAPPDAAAQDSANTSPSVTRVEPFQRLSEARTGSLLTPTAVPPADSPATMSPRDFCPVALDMCRKFWPLVGHFLNNPGIPVRDRELLILRTAYLKRVDYEWGQHYDIARRIGMTAEELARVTQGPDAPGWAAFDATLLRAVDELHSHHFISGATWESLAERYDDRQLVEVVLTVGNYSMLGMFFNALGVQSVPGLAKVPD